MIWGLVFIVLSIACCNVIAPAEPLDKEIMAIEMPIAAINRVL
jgi:hypothetical protein